MSSFANYSNETISTLNFAQCAKLVKNKAVINEEMEDHREENKKLREKINNLENIMKIGNNTNNININLFNNSKVLEMESQFNVSMKEISLKDEKIKNLQYSNEVLKDVNYFFKTRNCLS